MDQATPRLTLYLIHDPMCSWCWAFRPVWEQARARLPGGVRVERLLGGLAPDTDQPMPPELQAKISGIWRHIQTAVPGTRFNHEFWRRCQPRRSTYPACRAVIAALRQGAELEEPMILAIQRAYYLEARNPSDQGVLIDLAAELGLDARRFADELDSPAVQAELSRQIARSRELGATGFPSLVAAEGASPPQPIPLDYLDPEPMLRQIRRRR
jgi:putative protein-disulfide isomerase